MEWISVKDRLPEASSTDEWKREHGQSDVVLVWEQSQIYFGEFYHKYGNWGVHGRLGNIQVTHWAIIEPPKIV